MADAPESPLSKSLREAVESQARQLAAARDAYAARQQAKAAANDGDGDAKMLPPIEELAVEDAADAAAQPKGSSDESSDDDSRRVAQKKTDVSTPLEARPATPIVARDEMATDWERHPKASELFRYLQSQLPPEETGQILQLYVARETRVPLDGPNYNDLYASYKNSQARFDAQQRRARHQAALDAAKELRARCDLCSRSLDDDDDFNVGDRVKVGDERGVVTQPTRWGGWVDVRFDGQDQARSVRAGTLTSLDRGARGLCFRLGCWRERCASCHAANPLKAPLLCQECPKDIYFPDDAQTVFRPGAPKLYAAWSLEVDFRAELQKDSPDARAVMRFMQRDLSYVKCPEGVYLSDQLFMDALKERLLRMDQLGRWLGDVDLGVTAWRIRETINESRAALTLPSSRAWSLFVTFYVAQVRQRGLGGRAREGRHVVPGRVREAAQTRGRQVRVLQIIWRGLRRGREGGHGAGREARPRRSC